MIEKLNSTVLTDWHFDYDGYYWKHPNVPFKLNVANGGEAYYVTNDSAYQFGKVAPTVKNTCDLFMLISACFDYYVHKLNKVITSTDQLQTMIDEYLLSFNKELKSIVHVESENKLPRLIPGNEFTYTLVSGVQSHFTVNYVKDEEILTSELDIDPRCISNSYLLKYFSATKINSVKVRLMDGTDDDYFGLGL